MALNVSQTEALASALLRTESDLATSTDAVGQIAKGMQSNVEGNWNADMRKARQAMRTVESRVGVAKIQEQVLHINPDNVAGDTRRQDVEDRLRDYTALSESGVSAVRDTTHLDNSTFNRIDTHPDLPALLKDPININRLQAKMEKDDAYRMLVQERMSEIAKRTDFEKRRDQVVAAQEEVRKSKKTEADYEALRQSKKDEVADLETKKNTLATKKAEVEQRVKDKNAASADPSQDEMDFQEQYRSLQESRRNLAQLRTELRSRQYSNAPLQQQEALLMTKIDGLYAGIDKDRLLLVQTNDELEDADKTIQSKNRELVTLNSQESDIKKAVSDAEGVLKKQEDLYTQIEDEFIRDVEDVYGWAADQYIDRKLDTYAKTFEPEKSKYAAKMQEKEAQDFYDQFNKQWFVEKSTLRGRIKWKTFDKANILSDFDYLCKHGPDALLEDRFHIADEDTRKRLLPYCASTLTRLREDISGRDRERLYISKPDKWQMQDLRVRLKGILDTELGSDKSVSESLKAFDQGDTSNIDWYYAIMGVGTFASVLVDELSEDEEREKKAA